MLWKISLKLISDHSDFFKIKYSNRTFVFLFIIIIIIIVSSSSNGSSSSSSSGQIYSFVCFISDNKHNKNNLRKRQN